MISPLQIEFHNAQPTEAVESRIRQELAELEKFYNRLMSCRVEVAAPEHERRGSLSRVRVDFGLQPEDATLLTKLRGGPARQRPGHLEIRAQRKDAAMAVHAAFNIARRRLRDLAPLTGI